MRWFRHAALMGNNQNAYEVLVGKAAGRRWEDNIKIDLR
jgi:hypothetical protein